MKSIGVDFDRKQWQIAVTISSYEVIISFVKKIIYQTKQIINIMFIIIIISHEILAEKF